MRLLIALLLSFSILFNAANCDQNFLPVAGTPYHINNFRVQVLVIVEEYPYGLFKYNMDVEMNLYRNNDGKVEWVEIIENVNDYDNYLEEVFNFFAFGYVDAEYYANYDFKFRKYDTNLLRVTDKNKDKAQEIINDFLINYEYILSEDEYNIVLLDRVYKGSSRHYSNPILFWVKKLQTIFIRDLKREFRDD